jgi:hypothetical protein
MDTGEDWLAARLLPSCPEVPVPHAQRFPELSIAMLKAFAPDIVKRRDLPPTTDTGEERVIMVPSPSCPLVLKPQAQAYPLWSIAIAAIEADWVVSVENPPVLLGIAAPKIAEGFKELTQICAISRSFVF